LSDFSSKARCLRVLSGVKSIFRLLTRLIVIPSVAFPPHRFLGIFDVSFCLFQKQRAIPAVLEPAITRNGTDGTRGLAMTVETEDFDRRGFFVSGPLDLETEV
jgi:hypothetical protein